MGLDSVMLIEEIERFFCISIPDRMAEKIRTVNELVDYVTQELSLSDGASSVYVSVYEKVRKFISQNSSCKGEVSESTFVKDALQPLTVTVLQKLEGYLDLKIPTGITELKKGTDRFLLFTVPAIEHYDPDQVTVSDFCRCSIAFNYKKILTKSHVLTRMDVLMAVMGIIEDTLGIDVYAIKAHHSFTEDMGGD